MKILGTYKIQYENGVAQEKNLISHADFTGIIQPKLMEAYLLELDKKKEQASAIKAELINMFGEFFFTDKSPIYKAIESGYLILPESQGGSQKCTVTKI